MRERITSFIYIIIVLYMSYSLSESNDRLSKSRNENFRLLEENFELTEKETQLKELQKKFNYLEENPQYYDYYRFVKSTGAEINVAEYLKEGEKKSIDSKVFKDTLDKSKNFFVYEHISEIFQTYDSEFESVLKDFDEVKSEYGDGFFVKVMTFYNGQSLPLKIENSKTDIHILIQPTELGYKNRTFVISDFYNVNLNTLERKDDSVILIFEHGKYPRKRELITIKPELVKFGDK